MLGQVGQALLRELRLGDQRLPLDPLRAILRLARLPLLFLFVFGCGWVGPKESNDQNLRASTRASFESKLARVDARNLADDLLLCCVLAACCG